MKHLVLLPQCRCGFQGAIVLISKADGVLASDRIFCAAQRHRTSANNCSSSFTVRYTQDPTIALVYGHFGHSAVYSGWQMTDYFPDISCQFG